MSARRWPVERYPKSGVYNSSYEIEISVRRGPADFVGNRASRVSGECDQAAARKNHNRACGFRSRWNGAHQGSYGDLNVDGWDRPEVEVTVIKTLPYGYKAKQPDQGAADLDRIRIVTEHKSPPEVTISTALPSRSGWMPPFTRHTTGGVMASMRSTCRAIRVWRSITGRAPCPLTV